MFQGLPSKEYLRTLAHEGTFSWSSLATRSAIVAATVAGVMVGLSRLSSLVKPVAGAEPVELLKSMGWYALEVSTATALAAIAVGVLVSLLQTRGAFGLAALRRSKKGRSVINPASYVAGFVLVAAIAGTIFYSVWPDLLRVVSLTGNEALTDVGLNGGGLAQHAEVVFLRICKLLVVASVVLAILLVFVTRALFVLSLSGSRDRQDKDALVERSS